MITALTILDKSMNHIGFRQNYLSFTIVLVVAFALDLAIGLGIRLV